ncbi:MAG: hypothetical protein GY862_20100, partial [Gammaproteobacteria bacterium]|nr:hypothetical protein [Gammaproteobacteria bacterium]
NQVDPHDPSQGTDPAKEALVTIDAFVPHSAVASLPETSNSSFTVSWSGSDSASSVAAYNIYMRESQSDEWLLWQEQTAETSAGFNGEPGRSYEFYSIATDSAGHEEQKQALAEAGTATLLIVNVEALMNKSAYKTGELLRFTVNSNGDPARTDLYDLYTAIVLPDGDFVTIAYPLNFSLPGAIQAYKTSIDLAGQNSFSILDLSLPVGVARGSYQGCGGVTPANTDPQVMENWVHFDCREFAIDPLSVEAVMNKS